MMNQILDNAELARDLARVFNKHGLDNAMRIPDYVLADLTIKHLRPITIIDVDNCQGKTDSEKIANAFRIAREAGGGSVIRLSSRVYELTEQVPMGVSPGTRLVGAWQEPDDIPGAGDGARYGIPGGGR